MSTDTAPRCGRPMRRSGETCAKRQGHLRECRPRWVLDNQYRAKFGREPDPYAYRDGQWVPR